jgi:hypothetical protein
VETGHLPDPAPVLSSIEGFANLSGGSVDMATLNSPPKLHLIESDEPAQESTRPVRSLEDLRADIFDSDEELEEFLAFIYEIRQSGYA